MSASRSCQHRRAPWRGEPGTARRRVLSVSYCSLSSGFCLYPCCRSRPCIRAKRRNYRSRPVAQLAAAGAFFPQWLSGHACGRGEFLRSALQHRLHQAAEARSGEFPEHAIERGWPLREAEWTRTPPAVVNRRHPQYSLSHPRPPNSTLGSLADYSVEPASELASVLDAFLRKTRGRSLGKR